MDLPFPASINKNGKHKDLARGLEQPMKHIFLNPGSSKAITSELKAAVGYSMDKFKGQGAVPKFSPDVR